MTAPVIAQDIPNVPEPLVFDMVRPLGAKRGELEINTLVQQNLSGPDRAVEWAPEIEYAVADGLAIELELPIEGLSVTDYKMGLQGTIGTFAGGRGIHGIQYLGLYNRGDRRWESTLVYIAGFRFDDRWSTLSMVGFGDVTFSGPSNRNLIVNHTTFYSLTPQSHLGVEINTRRGGDDFTLVMPQAQFHLARGLSLQAGLGAARHSGEPWRPRAGARLIKEF
ncbi:hypothetical protein [Blastomonas aquatica]|uniref:Cellulose biosynthesis protein BcsS n=1 Tax=Blastomonas aquatica TaxID=1510276 RepID=A0ABQ1JAX9_9SPHN|nr:hypothetical protein [Blastomonas aquatica]GGB62001.1 hypothetical protein GCM10010833_16180 [Blastomonas aquatica]